MLSGEKILVTGPAGQIAGPMAAYLASENEVWGIARFSEEGSEERVRAMGVTTRRVDLASGDFGDLPDDFTYVLHLAAFQLEGLDYDWAITVNAEGTGLLMQHCRAAKAFLQTSTVAIYDTNPDPTHRYVETDPLSDSRQPYSPTYAVSKIAAEAVTRTMARALDLPTTIARINVAYGDDTRGGLPYMHFQMMQAGMAIPLCDPGPTEFSPIHLDDMCAQIEPLLAGASVPATITNWAGDEVVSIEEWCTYLGELAGIEPVFDRSGDGIPARAMDSSRRLALTGPCQVPFRDGLRRMLVERHPELGLD